MRHALSLSWVLSTVAVSIILKNAAVQIWGPEQIKFPSPFGDEVIHIGPAGIFPQELFIIFGAIGTVLLVQFFLKRAVLGKALIAVAYNRNAAAVMGINVQRMVVLAFVLSSALAGLGGMLIAPITFAWAYMGTVPGHQGVRGGHLRRPGESDRHSDRRPRGRACSSSSSGSSTRT